MTWRRGELQAHPLPEMCIRDRSFCGYMKTGLRHKDEQTESFQRYGLSSGIWPGNYKTVETTAETYVNGNNILFVNQRMPCTA